MNFLKIKAIGVFINRFFGEFTSSYFDKAINRFIKHNKKIWKNFNNNDEKSEVLFEITEMQPNIIAYSYFANTLGERFNAKIKAYSFGEEQRISKYLKKLYKSFNAES